MTTVDRLNVVTTLNGKEVSVSTLSPELQADFLINTDFEFFRSKANKIWRLENCYYITTKDGTKKLFKLNPAQLDFAEKYLMQGYKRLIILKARQLGFTTLIALWFLDEVIWNPNTEALQIAHTLKDAGELFNRKISYAMKNLYSCMRNVLDLSQSSAKKLQFEYQDEDGNQVGTSAISVSNSGRSGTFHLLHISELGKLSKLYQGRAEEVVTGTIPSVPTGGTILIESTAEGQSGLFYEMYSKALERKKEITSQLSNIEFYPVFYNWTWDIEEIERSNSFGTIKVSQMKECEIDWAEYQIDNNLTDKQISFYYTKYIAANEDIDKLHQEYPTNEMEAFIGSGSNYFSLRKTAELYEKAKSTEYKTYTYINGDFIEAVLNPEADNFEGLVVYKEPEQGRRYAIGADASEGLMDGDYSTATVIGVDKNIKALYRGKIEPDEFSKLLYALGKKYNLALLAVEFNKDGNWINTDLNTAGYPNLYLRSAIDDITHKVTKSYGWLTSKKTRDFMLGEAKKHFNSTNELFCIPLLKEIMSFVRDKRGKPQAAYGKHDDIVMSWAIAVAVLQGQIETIKQEQKPSLMGLLFSRR